MIRGQLSGIRERSLGDFLGAARNTATDSTSFASQVAVGVEATSVTEFAALGANLGVEIRAVLSFVSCGGSLSASFGSSHARTPYY